MMKVLLPVDGSPSCHLAIENVIHRVWCGQALDVHVIHVQRPPMLSLAGVVGADAPAPDDTRSRPMLDDASARLAMGGVRCQTHVELGDPAAEIVRYAELNGFDGIVVGTAGVGSISRDLAGSVTAKVLRLSAVPVEVVSAVPRKAIRNYAVVLGAGIGTLIEPMLD